MWRLGRSLYRGPVSKWGGVDSPPHYVHLPSTSQVIPETGISFQNRQENFGLYCICLSPFSHSTAPPRSFPPPHTLRVVRIIVNTPSWRPSAQCTSSYAWAWTPPCSRARPICWHSTNTQHSGPGAGRTSPPPTHPAASPPAGDRATPTRSRWG